MVRGQQLSWLHLYASLTDLPWRFPVFKDMVDALDKHVAAFAQDLQFNLDDRKLVLEDLWINILPEGAYHSAHIHPHSVISGRPSGDAGRASALRLEDPRHSRMMAALLASKTHGARCRTSST